MIEGLPNVALFYAQVVKMRQVSIPVSPEDKYGFHISTLKETYRRKTAGATPGKNITPVVSKISSGRRRSCTVVASRTSFWSRSLKRWCPDGSAHWRRGTERSSHVTSTATYDMASSPQKPAQISRSCLILRHSGYTLNTNWAHSEFRATGWSVSG